MNLKNVGSNMTQVETEQYIILFSYSTPVACNDKVKGKFYRTSEFHSVTTSRHINKWLDGASAEEKPQEFFNSLV